MAIHEHKPEPESYRHMQGSVNRAHEGSKSVAPNPAFGGNAEYKDNRFHHGGTKVDPSDKDTGNPAGLEDADE